MLPANLLLLSGTTKFGVEATLSDDTGNGWHIGAISERSVANLTYILRKLASSPIPSEYHYMNSLFLKRAFRRSNATNDMTLDIELLSKNNIEFERLRTSKILTIISIIWKNVDILLSLVTFIYCHCMARRTISINKVFVVKI